MSFIRYWNREKNREETEKIYGDKAIRIVYGPSRLQKTLSHILTSPLLSKIYGAYQSSPLSRHKIENFIEEFEVPIHEFKEKKYSSFNDFFIRSFNETARPFAKEASLMPAFAEGRYFGYEKVTPDQSLPVKGSYFSLEKLLGNEKESRPFMGGPLFICRLCPSDYHHFHFPDDGIVQSESRISGNLHSVNPLALLMKNDILITNERHVSILQTQNFGKIAYIEVGAMLVGKIVQTYAETKFQRGEEKGYFLFGGSTVILAGEPGIWKPSQDILEHTSRGQETLIKLGDVIAQRITSVPKYG